MRAPDAAELLALAESGERPLECLRRLLGAAYPGEDLDGDTPGARNRRLMVLRRALFGRRMACVASCDDCGALLDLELDTEAFLLEDRPGPAEGIVVPRGDHRLRFRLPTMADVTRAARSPERRAALREIALACCVEGERELLDDPALVTALSAAFEAADPLGHVSIELDCPGCRARSQPVLDLGALLWNEIRELASRLVGEVHALARAYGWSEHDILALPASRRRRYLELL